MPRWATASLVATALFGTVLPARGGPQWNVGAVGGVGGVGESAPWSRTRFAGALHGDVLFLRKSPRGAGVGPALELGTMGLADARLLAGATLLLPLGDLFSMSVTPAGYARFSDRTAGGVAFRALLGARSFAFDGGYSMTGGLVLGIDRDLDRRGEHALVVAVQVDGALLAIPFLALASLVRGPRD